jgi:hypothetical protein
MRGEQRPLRGEELPMRREELPMRGEKLPMRREELPMRGEAVSSHSLGRRTATSSHRAASQLLGPYFCHSWSNSSGVSIHSSLKPHLAQM